MHPGHGRGVESWHIPGYSADTHASCAAIQGCRYSFVSFVKFAWVLLTSRSHDNCTPAFTALNRVLANPQESKTAFKIGHHSEDDFYTWMETRPIQQGAFHRFMEAQFAMLPTWLDAVPFDTEIAHDAGADDVVFVDVGGGNGSQCAALKTAFPDFKGRIILQDRPDVLEKALKVDGMELMAHDFLTEQPVHSKFARGSSQPQTITNNPRRTRLLLPPDLAQLQRRHMHPNPADAPTRSPAQPP